MIRTDLPEDNQALRQEIHDGTIFLLPRSDASMALVRDVLSLLREQFGPDELLRQAHAGFAVPDLLARVGAVRQVLLREGAFLHAIRAVMAGAGFGPDEHAIDFPRLRAILHGGHENPAAAAAYAIHRDTWYGNPQAQINFWVPLHDVNEEQSFFFYPDLFARPVANSSVRFDYDEWVRRVGWQSPRRDPDAVYPAVLADPGPAGRLHVSCALGQVLLFSAAHCHGTCHNSSGLTRFSVDFRTVHLGDHRAGRGAPNVDNRSTGSALRDYVHP